MLQNWLTLAGVKNGEVLIWQALKETIQTRLDPQALDDGTVLELGTRPKLLDQLLSNHQGRDFTLRLLLSTRAKSDCDGSAFLCHCLREIVVTGHARELLQAKSFYLSR